MNLSHNRGLSKDLSQDNFFSFLYYKAQMFGYFEWKMQACIISPTTIIKMRSVSSWFLINGLKTALL